jgi:hypothetical protein
LSADEGAHPVDDQLENLVDREETGDPADGRIEGGLDFANAPRRGDLRIDHRRRG